MRVCVRMSVRDGVCEVGRYVRVALWVGSKVDGGMVEVLLYVGLVVGNAVVSDGCV